MASTEIYFHIASSKQIHNIQLNVKHDAVIAVSRVIVTSCDFARTLTTVYCCFNTSRLQYAVTSWPWRSTTADSSSA